MSEEQRCQHLIPMEAHNARCSLCCPSIHGPYCLSGEEAARIAKLEKSLRESIRLMGHVSQWRERGLNPQHDKWLAEAEAVLKEAEP